MNKKYTASYFIKKFRAIPSRKWTTRRFYDDEHSTYCALGHCGSNNLFHTKEGAALADLFFSRLLSVTDVNDGLICASLKLKQKTPRGRVLAALRHIQNGTVPRKIA